MAESDVYRETGEAAWAWVLGQVREEDGPWLAERVVEGEPQAEPAADRDCLYAGIGGLAPVLAEIARCRPLEPAERELAAGIVARLSRTAATRTEPSLYDGLAGDATALRLLAPGTEAIALRRLTELMTPDGWDTTLDLEPGYRGPVLDLVAGTAGVMLAALWTGGEQARAVLETGGESLLRTADRTEGGLDWGMIPGAPSRCPNYAHGTAGIATALALAGAELGRPEFVEAAVLGARHLLAVGSTADGGFVVPHTIPPSTREVEPVTYTWCHGPAGTSHLFAALARAGVQEVGGFGTEELRRRCLHSVLASGLPERLRPGFWDNDGRCCGTAGVGDILLDAAQAAWADGQEARAALLLRGAHTMGEALLERAVRDQGGARWQFLEHRQDPPLLPPNTSWMQGAAGIAAYLLRLARVTAEGLTAPVVDRPDQWWAVPAGLRTVRTG
ncbi:Lanthionine synthetase [Kitasatospora sp. MMS16-BH015]|uniref:lanthionine synthetase LanC family protein n=1 Tax=Kitasatospora sp. MMS16-BH015 TaxID=2018025 RepID=UPI000CA0BDE1|nr:lanthionine synthetase LanC family protein [Kitasatospora sp. MMS16-BH015]AUG81926.1 Lanthionine synthetase [Kitasatospora sp. MMS16-BH015]